MKIVFLGGGQWGLFPLKRLLQKEQVTGIVAPVQDPLVVREGLKNQIPTCEITGKHEPKFEAFLKACRPDLIVVAGFPFILPKESWIFPLKEQLIFTDLCCPPTGDPSRWNGKSSMAKKTRELRYTL